MHQIREAALVVWLLSCCSSFLAADSKPNLLIIMTDEHNFRTLGCYRELLSEDQAFVWGSGVVVETPHIDSLASEGALCTSFYGTTPLCAPSRASFFTGLYPHATGVPINHVSMNDDMVTFAEVLRRQSYKTGYIGKWHLDGLAKPGWEPERKFGWEDNRYMYNRGHWKNIKESADGPYVDAPKDENGMPNYDLGDADENSFATDFLTDRTIEFMDAHKEEPFCVMLSIPDPHQPDTVRPPYDTMYSHFDFQTPKTLFKTKAQTPDWIVGNLGDAVDDHLFQKENMAGYFGMVRLIDDNVGKILKFLKDNQLDENTIVVFTSDHGDLLGEHSRLNKRMPYEGSAISPLIVRYPGNIKSGKLIHSSISTADFPNTFLSLMDSVNVLDGVHGRDLSSQFLNPDSIVRSNEVTYIRGVMSPLGPPPYWLAAITDRYKLVIGKNEKPWLIDLEKDPDEVINFYSKSGYESTRARLTKELKRLLVQTEDPAMDDPDLVQWLR